MKSLRFVSDKLYSDNLEEQIDLYSWWILKYLRYDVGFTNASMEKSLKSGKGVCLHYATFFDSLCFYRGIKSELIHGYCKIFNVTKIELRAHAWNTVEFNGQKRYLDLTWTDEDLFLDSIKLSEFYLMEEYPFYLSHFDKSKFSNRFLKLYKFKRSADMYGSFYLMRPLEYWDKDKFYRVKNLTKGVYLTTASFCGDVEFLEVYLIRGIFDEKIDINETKISCTLNNITNGVYFLRSEEKFKRNEYYSLILRVKMNNRIKEVVMLYGKK